MRQSEEGGKTWTAWRGILFFSQGGGKGGGEYIRAEIREGRVWGSEYGLVGVWRTSFKGVSVECRATELQS